MRIWSPVESAYWTSRVRLVAPAGSVPRFTDERSDNPECQIVCRRLAELHKELFDLFDSVGLH